jgi:hypothetical protein
MRKKDVISKGSSTAVKSGGSKKSSSAKAVKVNNRRQEVVAPVIGLDDETEVDVDGRKGTLSNNGRLSRHKDSIGSKRAAGSLSDVFASISSNASGEIFSKAIKVNKRKPVTQNQLSSTSIISKRPKRVRTSNAAGQVEYFLKVE